jgi:transposase
MEACATAHHWARAIAALGHEVRLMPPQYVKANVKRNKNDAADAEAICEAVCVVNAVRAPVISNRRTYPSPRLLIRPSHVLPPVPD